MRESDLPQKTSEDRYLSEYARTLYEAGATTDAMVSGLESAVAAEDFSYEWISNQKLLDDAEDAFKTKGIEGLQKAWNSLLDDANVRYATAKDIAVGQFLYNEYVKNGDYDSAIKTAVELSTEATRAGRAVQSFRLLKKLTPDGQLYAMEQTADRMTRDLKKMRGAKKAPNIEIDQYLAKVLLQAKTPEEINSAVDDIKWKRSISWKRFADGVCVLYI